MIQSRLMFPGFYLQRQIERILAESFVRPLHDCNWANKCMTTIRAHPSSSICDTETLLYNVRCLDRGSCTTHTEESSEYQGMHFKRLFKKHFRSVRNTLYLNRTSKCVATFSRFSLSEFRRTQFCLSIPRLVQCSSKSQIHFHRPRLLLGGNPPRASLDCLPLG